MLDVKQYDIKQIKQTYFFVLAKQLNQFSYIWLVIYMPKNKLQTHRFNYNRN